MTYKLSDEQSKKFKKIILDSDLTVHEAGRLYDMLGKIIPQIRNDALEEAALMAEKDYGHISSVGIRMLKEKR